MTWRIAAHAPRARIEAALLAHEDAVHWDPEIVLAGSEVAEDRPDDWRLEAWLPRAPDAADIAAIEALFASDPPTLAIERLPERDWVTLSQQAIMPIRAGAFRVRTPDHPPVAEPGVREFVIPASQAFGTGHHATTAGCLTMLSAMKRRGVVVRNLIDVGTGTGLLAFAGLELWPRTVATASDIDPVCAGVVLANAAANAVPIGARPGALTPVVAPGLDHPLLAVRGPYDLVVANILAGPLIALAPAFSAALRPRGHLLLAGLLTGQERAVRRACFAVGLRLAARVTSGDWPILWLRKRRC